MENKYWLLPEGDPPPEKPPNEPQEGGDGDPPDEKPPN